MKFLNNKSDDLTIVSPFLGENAPVPIDLWKAQNVWTSLVGLSTAPAMPTTPTKLTDTAPPKPGDTVKP